MKRILLTFLIFGILLALMYSFSNDTQNVDDGLSIVSYTYGTYEIEGESVTLYDGMAETDVVDGSASKTTTRYFGNDAWGDLNGDGMEDVAFLLTQERGGSGTFYYTVVALGFEDGFQGTNGIFLGDRIAPQPIIVEDGVVIVNYAERKPDESFSTPPSVGVSKYLKVIDGELVEVEIGSILTSKTWTWVRTQMNNDDVILPKGKDVFTIIFNEDGSFNGTTDCNSFFGTYEVGNNTLSFGDIASTKMFCGESQEGVFLNTLGEIQNYLIDDRGNLVLEIRLDSGVMIFK